LAQASDTRSGIGAEPALVGRAVEIDHDLVDLNCCSTAISPGASKSSPFTASDGLPHPFAEIARLVVVAQFHRLMRAGGGARRHRARPIEPSSSTTSSHGGIAAAIGEFRADDVDDGCHDLVLPYVGCPVRGVLTRRAGNVNACPRLGLTGGHGQVMLPKVDLRVQAFLSWSRG